MKKLLTLAFFLCLGMTAFSQKGLYLSVAGGPHFKSQTDVLTSGGTLKGSYGEGIQFQLRTGYFFTEKLGLELGFGYLLGKEQQVVETAEQNIRGRANAVGAHLNLVYNITSNFYARGGLLTKLGGHTLIEGELQKTVPASVFNPAAPAGLNTTIDVMVERKNTGSFPLGYTVGLGYKYPLADNMKIFAEADYSVINVSANKSERQSFAATATTAGQSQPLDYATLASSIQALASAGALSVEEATRLGGFISEEFEYGEGTVAKYDAPYSSFGVVLGLTFSF